jgi:predicted TIM-barrel fold metal-dependent hydrolase
MQPQKIAMEEHIEFPEHADAAAHFYPKDVWATLRKPLLDIHGHMLASMDANGIEMAVLSLNAPGIQAIPNKKEALETARRSNDYMAEQVAKNPKRFQAFAALPLQDPEAASRELVRCVRELGFKGTLVNGFSQSEDSASTLYYDLPQYREFWATLEGLDVPFYMHPRQLVGERSDVQGHPWLQASAWSFGVEVATHALRLMGSGLFDAYPKLKVILGHLGETLPHAIWRVDHRIKAIPRGVPAKKPFWDYLRNNFYVTTSGNFNSLALQNTILSVGADRILFATDYPYETMTEAAEWLDGIEVISEADKLKIAHSNAAKLLKIGTAKQATVSA